VAVGDARVTTVEVVRAPTVTTGFFYVLRLYSSGTHEVLIRYS